MLVYGAMYEAGLASQQAFPQAVSSSERRAGYVNALSLLQRTKDEGKA